MVTGSLALARKRWIVGSTVILVTGVLLAATLPAMASLNTELNIINVPPIVGTVTLPETEILPSAGAATSITTTITVTDANGCNDIDHVRATIQKPDGTVHIAATDATYQSCSLGTLATYSYTFEMGFHDAPALSSSSYKIQVVATDKAGATGSNLLSLLSFNYLELVAVNIADGSLDFGGPLDPGDSSATVGLSIVNHGNVPIDMQLSGTTLDHATESASIPVAAAKYSQNSDMSSSASLSTSATLLGLGLVAGASSSSTVYWSLDVPSGEDQWIPSGDYTGTLTASAVKSS